MRGAVITLLVIALVGFGAYSVLTTSQNQELKEELRPPNVQVMDSGVFVPLAAIKSAYGENTPVRVHVSPPDAETMGAKSIDVDGTVHLWVPSRFVGGISSLTQAEAQEYVVRQLAGCQGNCSIDYKDAGLDAGTLRSMAADENVDRASGSSDIMGDYELMDLFKYTLKLSSEDHRAGLDAVVRVSESGDRTQESMMWAAMMPYIVGSVAVVVLLFMFLQSKNKNGGGG